MANNVYIGARYVPVFDGAWNSTKVYEPLTIVEYQNSSYTSKKAVPAGTLPTNTTYWALSGNYNGQIADLQNRMTNAENAIEDNADDITTISNGLKHKNIICIGDSYATQAQSWGYWLNQIYAEATVINKGIGGGGFIGTAAKTYLQLLQEVSVADNDSITDIVCLGGMNDRTFTEANIQSAMSAFATYAKTTYPNAKLHVGFCGWQITGFAGRSDNLKSLYLTIDIYRRCSALTGFNYVNGMEYIMPALSASYYNNDYIHPTSAASKFIAEGLYNYLFTGYATSPTFAYDTVALRDLQSHITAVAVNTLKVTTHDSQISLNGGILELNIDGILPTNSWYLVGIVDGNPLRGSNQWLVQLYTKAIYFRYDNTFEFVPCEIKIDNSALYVRVITSTGGNVNMVKLQVEFPSIAMDVLTTC